MMVLFTLSMVFPITWTRVKHWQLLVKVAVEKLSEFSRLLV